jgi:hypothetical protein
MLKKIIRPKNHLYCFVSNAQANVMVATKEDAKTVWKSSAATAQFLCAKNVEITRHNVVVMGVVFGVVER